MTETPYYSEANNVAAQNPDKLNFLTEAKKYQVLPPVIDLLSGPIRHYGLVSSKAVLTSSEDRVAA